MFDLFLMPSLFEAFPITLIEAQANGLVSLVSDTVTQKCNITGLIEFMSLTESASAWAETSNKKLTIPRVDTTKIICEKYNIPQIKYIVLRKNKHIKHIIVHIPY